jgi:hypothetical protein
MLLHLLSPAPAGSWFDDLSVPQRWLAEWFGVRLVLWSSSSLFLYTM